jgi:hypothetical protein
MVRAHVQRLHELTQRLATRDDTQRKQALVKYFEQTHREVARLYVIARWLASLERLQQCWRVFGTLDGVDEALRGAADGLYHEHAGLAEAMAPLYDVARAAGVMSTGSYDALPRAMLAAAPAARAPLDAARCAAALRRLDHELHMRLLTAALPPDVAAVRVRVARGRLLVSAPLCYAASLSLLGDAPLHWRLLDVRLLPHVRRKPTSVLRSDTVDNDSGSESDADDDSDGDDEQWHDSAMHGDDELRGMRLPAPLAPRVLMALQRVLDNAEPNRAIAALHDALVPLCLALTLDTLASGAASLAELHTATTSGGSLLPTTTTTTTTTTADSGSGANLAASHDGTAVATGAGAAAAAAGAERATGGGERVSGVRQQAAASLRSSTSALPSSGAEPAHRVAPLRASYDRGAGVLRVAYWCRQAASDRVAAPTLCIAGDNVAASLRLSHEPSLPLADKRLRAAQRALRRLDFVALLRVVVDARAAVALEQCHVALTDHLGFAIIMRAVALVTPH